MAAKGRIVIAGGSGFLGTSLAHALLLRGNEVTVLSRGGVKKPVEGVTYVQWDGRTLGDWVRALDGADALINLAGRSVDCIKTPENCDAILRSRVEATHILGRAQRNITFPPRVWVQMGTAHIYGDPASCVCDESSALGYGLAPDVGRAWEGALADSVLPAQRNVILRTSFVIGKDRGNGGGAISRLRSLCRLGLGGRVGNGTQGFSWIHEDDMNRIFLAAIEDEAMHGAYVTSAPAPVPQARFMQELRKYAGGLGGLGLGLPAPAFLVRIGAPLIMRTDPELALYGRYVVPTRLLTEHKFIFNFPALGPALKEVLG
jgi:uncharacterized protein (TIGR01777 family)